MRQPTERNSGAEETRRYKTKHYSKGEINSEEQAGLEAQRQDRTGREDRGQGQQQASQDLQELNNKL